MLNKSIIQIGFKLIGAFLLIGGFWLKEMYLEQ